VVDADDINFLLRTDPHIPQHHSALTPQPNDSWRKQMIIKLSSSASDGDLRHVVEAVQASGCRAHVKRRDGHLSVVAVGPSARRDSLFRLESAAGVSQLVSTGDPYELASRKTQPERTRVKVGDAVIGDGSIVVIAGPCSVETREQMLAAARSVANAGATMLRGGAYKPRTSPYEFQGLGVDGLKLLAEARDETGLPVVTEVVGTDDVDIVCEYADMLQVGARNMQNFPLLKRLAKCEKPILLKRGASATVKEWLLAAEYLLAGGNEQVVLCERGIKSFDTEATRNTLDVGAIALAKQLSHLPVIADPSHATGKRSLVTSVARAAIAAGADGIIVEVHPCPEKALSDGPQSLDCPMFKLMMESLFAPLPRLAAQHVGTRAELQAVNA
jgi:3-deoxy-7-phosphoheptulonate synthase